MLSTTCPGSHNLAPRHRKLLMKQQSNASKCSTNLIGYCARLFAGAFISPSKFGKFPSSRHSVLFDGRCRSTAYSISACGSDLRQLQTKQIRSPKADGSMLAIRVKTAEVQRITTPLPLLLAFLVASHITELEGVMSVIIGLLQREEITLGVIAPLKRAILGREIVKSPTPLREHRKRAPTSSAKQIL
ncbi:hypothetical protein CI102_10247 [Trichoderma harzianum]|uniref:Uncharacterized protein n=1 Tax=Trichoderma harzianum CBS 226.95 TaxID=983964 RepID=A0A2T4AC43_TRIHA|nr:hypothetical protein M431DRAFT_425284 [Trichoderma harzianum CBS 226.95]PKK44663.1 hypothetical protein CI102_10247 [Trichoderma harzianum]PTB54650.1 hypothetical protein M431DRAFT_425284 [Trichoderma harzianum CBS 226.95]